jgi:hemoglobin-like flavoprotein
MPLTSNQIQLVRHSWKSLRGIKPALIADIFYTKLFSENPRLRKMFPADMDAQYTKLMDMLNSIVIRLDRMDELSEDITAMAIRHRGYGVKLSHYKPVGDALLWTLQQALGRDWIPELADAWSTCYNTLTDIMIEAEKKAFSNSNK